MLEARNYHTGALGPLWSCEPVLTACLWGTLRQQEKGEGKMKFSNLPYRAGECERGRGEED